MSAEDTRLAHRAIEQRWNIEDKYRDAMIRRLTQIVIDPQSSNREVTAASKALIAAEGQNQKDDQYIEQANEGRNRFLAIADRLGLISGTARVTDGRTTTDTFDADGRAINERVGGRTSDSTRANGSEAVSGEGPTDTDTDQS